LPFQLVKVSDQGTENPIVARLSVQTSELIKFCSRGEDFNNSVFSLFHEKVQKHLLECDQIAREIHQEVLDIDAEIGDEGIKTQADGRVIEVPHVMRLVPRVEQFLYCAKSALRDLAEIFELFWGKKFEGARYDKIIAWAKEEYGDDSELVRLLEQDHDQWIKKLVAMRNAVEHPGGYSGYLHIHNIALVSPDHPRYPTLEPPRWNLNDDPEKSLVDDLLTFTSNILEFSEDLLIICIKMSGLPDMLGFSEIPKEKRDPTCPIRIRVVPKSL